MRESNGCLLGYSSRKTCMVSTRAARIAGTSEATAARDESASWNLKVIPDPIGFRRVAVRETAPCVPIPLPPLITERFARASV